MLICVRRRAPIERLQFERFDPGWGLKIVRLGVPIGLAIFVEASIFSVIALFLSPLGAVAVAGHQIALNLSSLVFMFPLTVAMAATTRLGICADGKVGAMHSLLDWRPLLWAARWPPRPAF